MSSKFPTKKQQKKNHNSKEGTRLNRATSMSPQNAAKRSATKFGDSYRWWHAPNYRKEGKKNEKKNIYFLHCPTLSLAKKISQKQISSENTPHLRSNKFHPNEVPAGPNTLLSVENSTSNHRTPAADEPPPPFTLLVFDEQPPSFSCSLSPFSPLQDSRTIYRSKILSLFSFRFPLECNAPTG